MKKNFSKEPARRSFWPWNGSNRKARSATKPATPFFKRKLPPARRS